MRPRAAAAPQRPHCSISQSATWTALRAISPPSTDRLASRRAVKKRKKRFAQFNGDWKQLAASTTVTWRTWCHFSETNCSGNLLLSTCWVKHPTRRTRIFINGEIRRFTDLMWNFSRDSTPSIVFIFIPKNGRRGGKEERHLVGSRKICMANCCCCRRRWSHCARRPAEMCGSMTTLSTSSIEFYFFFNWKEKNWRKRWTVTFHANLCKSDGLMGRFFFKGVNEGHCFFVDSEQLDCALLTLGGVKEAEEGERRVIDWSVIFREADK